MSREKQIEEMIKILHEGMKPLKETYGTNEIASILYNAGYRKQSEGEWKAYPDEHWICATEFVCSNCKESFSSSEMTDKEFLEMMKFCPNCGSKMKGGE